MFTTHSLLYLYSKYIYIYIYSFFNRKVRISLVSLLYEWLGQLRDALYFFIILWHISLTCRPWLVLCFLARWTLSFEKCLVPSVPSARLNGSDLFYLSLHSITVFLKSRPIKTCLDSLNCRRGTTCVASYRNPKISPFYYTMEDWLL